MFFNIYIYIQGTNNWLLLVLIVPNYLVYVYIFVAHFVRERVT